MRPIVETAKKKKKNCCLRQKKKKKNKKKIKKKIYTSVCPVSGVEITWVYQDH